MEPHSQWLSHLPEIYRNQNIFPQDFPKHKQFDYSPASSVPFNPIQNTPPSSCLTTLDSSSITHELDNNSIPTYSPSINYSSTKFYNISDGDWNGNEVCMQQGMNFVDPNPSQLAEVMNLPNLFMNAYQPSLFDLQQRMGLMLESNFSYFGSPIIGSGLAENAFAMEMGLQENLFDIPTQSDQINKMTEDGIVDREFERKQDRKLKNRESAARSRVKKQAHLNYLEQKSWKLKRENELLGKELVFLRSIPIARIQLRRSSSCEFLENKTLL